MSDTGVLTIHTDGAARGNPGPAAFAYIIEQDGRPTIEEKGTLGQATNNVAEYTALVRALEHAVKIGGRRAAVKSDSELMVKQMKGEYQVKNEDLRALFKQGRALAAQLDQVTFQHIRREQNSRADRLCNEALDGDGSRAPASGSARKAGSPRVTSERKQSVSEDAILCLQAAARAWSRGDASVPAPELVWDQLWSILEEGGVVRAGQAK